MSGIGAEHQHAFDELVQRSRVRTAGADRVAAASAALNDAEAAKLALVELGDALKTARMQLDQVSSAKTEALKELETRSAEAEAASRAV